MWREIHMTTTSTTYFANPTRAARQAMLDGQLGYIDTPAQGNHRPAGVVWCADNGAFSDRWNADRWWAWLQANADDASDCAFAVAPDVVGDAAATLERSRPWLARIRDLGYPAAYVAQDGWDPDVVPWDEIDALFIGGSTEFKLGPVAADAAAEAKRRGLWVHIGRVNSLKRLRYAASIGADSVDGTYLTFGPDQNLPKLLGWLEALDADQQAARSGSQSDYELVA
jgi:hypothetical protein